MQKRCKTCGATLEQDTFICPSCGSLPDSHTNDMRFFDANPEEATPAVEMSFGHVKTNRFPRWLIGAGIAAVLLVTLAFTWQALLMLVAPKTALTLALGTTGKDLQQRYSNSPATVIAESGTYLRDGMLSVNADVSYEGEQMQAQLNLAFNKERKQTAAGAALTLREKSYHANFYLDPEFAAVSTDLFNDGTYYGVTFETFKADIRKSIFGEELSDAQIENINSFIQAFLDVYTLDIDRKELIKPYKRVIKQYIKDLEAEKSNDTIFVDDKEYSCSTLTYSLSESDLYGLLDKLLDTLEDDDDLKAIICREQISNMTGSSIKDRYEKSILEMREALNEAIEEADFSLDVVFYIRNGRVVSMELTSNIEADGDVAEISAEISFGLNTKSDIVIDLSVNADDEIAEMKLTSEVTDEQDYYKETLTAEVNIPHEDKVKVTFATKWNKNNGKLTLSAKAQADSDTQEFSMQCTLNKLSNGFELTIDRKNLEDFLSQIDAGTLPEGLEFTVIIRCTKGADIAKPEYVNIDQFDAALLQQLQEILSKTFS